MNRDNGRLNPRENFYFLKLTLIKSYQTLNLYLFPIIHLFLINLPLFSFFQPIFLNIRRFSFTLQFLNFPPFSFETPIF